MISQEAKKIIEENPIAIATCVFDIPNVSVAAFCKVEEGKIIITDNYMAKTVAIIQKNNKIELAVWDKDWKGYKISGRASYEISGKWLDYVKNIPENDGLPAKGAIIVTIDNIKRIGD